MTSLHFRPGEAQRQLPEEVLQPKELPGTRTAANQTVRTSDPGGNNTHTHACIHSPLRLPFVQVSFFFTSSKLVEGYWWETSLSRLACCVHPSLFSLLPLCFAAWPLPCTHTQGLRLLHDSGVFYGHLHASNVIVEDGVCRLADVENGMLGVPSVLRPAYAQFRKINVSRDSEPMMLFCFFCPRLK